MIGESINTARNETDTAKAGHRSLHRCRITKNVFTLGSFRHASHAENRRTRSEFDTANWVRR